MTKQTFDLLVVGAGPAGYAAAIRGAQLGLKTAVIDRARNPDDGSLEAYGGTCANVGCIPSKALLAASLAYERARNGNAAMGVTVAPGAVTMDFAAMQAHRAQCVKASNRGIAGLFKRRGVAAFAGSARFVGNDDGAWVMQTETERFAARSVILAVGTRARHIAGVEVDEVDVVTSSGALKFDRAPETLGIIGAGVIGLELGSVWRRLGSRVTLLDAADGLLGTFDRRVAAGARRIFEKQGLAFELGVRIESVQKSGALVRVRGFDAFGKPFEHVFEKLLVAVGRSSCAADLAPEAAGLKLDARGSIVVDERCRTNLPGVWAVGDAVRGVQLAHKARAEAVSAAEQCAGLASAPAGLIPAVVYTHPEIACVGMTEESARAAGFDAVAAEAPFAANGRARAVGETEGMVRVIVDRASDRILGAHILGECAAEMIAEATAAIEFGATAEDVGLVSHAHPTFSEAFREACLAARGEAVDL